MRRTIALIGGLGATLMYFFDPQNGRRRRHMLRDRTLAFFRRSGRRAERFGHKVAAEGEGLAHQAAHLQEEPKPQPDDASLVDKVRSEIFRDVDVPSGQININAEQGKVVLRGEVEQPELIEQLVERTRNVQGVREVENLLHVPS
jgi:osmotically-inducible protein OsmY